MFLDSSYFVVVWVIFSFFWLAGLKLSWRWEHREEGGGHSQCFGTELGELNLEERRESESLNNKVKMSHFSVIKVQMGSVFTAIFCSSQYQLFPFNKVMNQEDFRPYSFTSSFPQIYRALLYTYSDHDPWIAYACLGSTNCTQLIY